MNEELLKMAQEEYSKQYQSWLTSKPDEDSIISSYEKLAKILKKYQDSHKTDKEKGSGDSKNG